MATTQTTPAVPATVGSAPANLEQHHADLERRAKEQQKNRAKHLKCLDPTVAAEYEARKPLYEWKIEVAIFRPARGKDRARTEQVVEQVVAQNEDDAWAMFCDKIGEWPSRRDSNPKITRLQKRTFED